VLFFDPDEDDPEEPDDEPPGDEPDPDEPDDGPDDAEPELDDSLFAAPPSEDAPAVSACFAGFVPFRESVR
jgi:hypothetical protein